MDVFHGDWRAPKASRPIITVEATEDAMGQLLAAFGIPSLDFAIGERGQEEVMIKVSPKSATGTAWEPRHGARRSGQRGRPSRERIAAG